TFVVRHLFERSGARTNRQLQEVLWHLLAVLLQGVLERRVGERFPRIGGANGEDPVHEAKFEGPAVPYAGDTSVRHRIHGDHASQMWRPGTGERVLRAA